MVWVKQIQVNQQKIQNRHIQMFIIQLLEGQSNRSLSLGKPCGVMVEEVVQISGGGWDPNHYQLLGLYTSEVELREFTPDKLWWELEDYTP